jgi:hypothetical protein
MLLNIYVGFTNYVASLSPARLGNPSAQHATHLTGHICHGGLGYVQPTKSAQVTRTQPAQDVQNCTRTAENQERHTHTNTRRHGAHAPALAAQGPSESPAPSRELARSRSRSLSLSMPEHARCH